MLFTARCITLTDANFQAEVLEAPMPVLVDCWASWCGACHQINPIIEALAIEFADDLKVARLDVGSSERLAARYDIPAVPTLFRNAATRSCRVLFQPIYPGHESAIAPKILIAPSEDLQGFLRSSLQACFNDAAIAHSCSDCLHVSLD